MKIEYIPRNSACSCVVTVGETFNSEYTHRDPARSYEVRVNGQINSSQITSSIPLKNFLFKVMIVKYTFINPKYPLLFWQETVKNKMRINVIFIKIEQFTVTSFSKSEIQMCYL